MINFFYKKDIKKLKTISLIVNFFSFIIKYFTKLKKAKIIIVKIPK